jgi:hypothetical protein
VQKLILNKGLDGKEYEKNQRGNTIQGGQADLL